MSKRASMPASKWRIADLPSFAEKSSAAIFVKMASTWFPRLAPAARLLGVDTEKIKQSLDKVATVGSQLEMAIGLPDRFNDLYASRGWVAYDMLHQQVMTDAIAKGEAGDFSAGESLLMDYYTADVIEFQLDRMRRLKHFRERDELAKLAKVDYLEGRYHACIPSVLMLIDGLATDAAQSNESFFAKDTDLTAWDSVVGHATGIPALAVLMSMPRMKRRTDSLTIPYRHGILHGRDLGFANKLVAAKTWAALFALGEWAKKVERGEKNPPQTKPKPSPTEFLRRFARKRKSSHMWRQWRRRDLIVGRDIPATGSPELYKLGTPERLLIGFLTAWSKRNFGEMAKQVVIGADRVDPRTRAKDVNHTYNPHRLKEFVLRSIEERGPMSAAISVHCVLENGDAAEIQFLLIYEDEKGDWLNVEWGQGTWRIHNWRSVTATFLKVD